MNISPIVFHLFHYIWILKNIKNIIYFNSYSMQPISIALIIKTQRKPRHLDDYECWLQCLFIPRTSVWQSLKFSLLCVDIGCWLLPGVECWKERKEERRKRTAPCDWLIVWTRPSPHGAHDGGFGVWTFILDVLCNGWRSILFVVIFHCAVCCLFIIIKVYKINLEGSFIKLLTWWQRRWSN